MAKTQQKDILTRFQDLAAEALHRLQDVPGGSKLVEAVNDTKTRLDEMQKKLRGLDELEKRVAKLEKQLAAAVEEGAGPAQVDDGAQDGGGSETTRLVTVSY